MPTDIGSTSHASDFCYMTAHDNMTCYTTRYSVEFYDAMGHYSRVGGLEVARMMTMNEWPNSSAKSVQGGPLAPTSK